MPVAMVKSQGSSCRPKLLERFSRLFRRFFWHLLGGFPELGDTGRAPPAVALPAGERLGPAHLAGGGEQTLNA